MQKFSFKFLFGLLIALMALAPVSNAQVEIILLESAPWDDTIADFINANSDVPVNINITNWPGGVTSPTLQAADLIVIGRSHSSFAFNNQDSRDVFNALTVPIVSFSPFIARQSRLNWFSHDDIQYEHNIATVQVADSGNPFLGSDAIADTYRVFEDGPYTPPLYRSGASLTAHKASVTSDTMENNNGTAVLTITGYEGLPIPVFAVWDAGTPTYSGSSTTPAGPRYLLNVLDDRNYADSGDSTVADYQLDTLSAEGAELFRRVLNSVSPGLPVDLGRFDLQ